MVLSGRWDKLDITAFHSIRGMASSENSALTTINASDNSGLTTINASDKSALAETMSSKNSA